MASGPAGLVAGIHDISVVRAEILILRAGETIQNLKRALARFEILEGFPGS